ncbi:hypothetical protein Tco_1203752 [Tanacetum coccineum]
MSSSTPRGCCRGVSKPPKKPPGFDLWFPVHVTKKTKGLCAKEGRGGPLWNDLLLTGWLKPLLSMKGIDPTQLMLKDLRMCRGNVQSNGTNDGNKRDSFYQDQGAGRKSRTELFATYGEQEAKILAYNQAVKKLEAQIVTFQKQQLSLNEQLTFQANELYEKDEKLKKYRRIGMKAVKEKEQLQKNVDFPRRNLLKNLWKLVNSEEDFVDKPLYNRFSKTDNFKGVPHPLTGDYTPKPQQEIDESLIIHSRTCETEISMSVNSIKLIFFLGLQVKQKTYGLFISQDKYVAEMLKKFDLTSVKTAITPMETKMALTKDEEADEVDVTPKTSNLDAVRESLNSYEKKLIRVNYKIIKQGRKGVYQIVRENGTDMVYISFGAMLTDISRDDLTELYRIVMKKHGMNEPEDEFEKVLWEYLKNMFEEPLSTDSIWSLPGQQRIICWRYYDACRVHCLNLESADVYMLIERKYPLSAEVCKAMLDKKLQGGKPDEDCYKLLKMMEKQAGIRK